MKCVTEIQVTITLVVHQEKRCEFGYRGSFNYMNVCGISLQKLHVFVDTWAIFFNTHVIWCIYINEFHGSDTKNNFIMLKMTVGSINGYTNVLSVLLLNVYLLINCIHRRTVMVLQVSILQQWLAAPNVSSFWWTINIKWTAWTDMAGHLFCMLTFKPMRAVFLLWWNRNQSKCLFWEIFSKKQEMKWKNKKRSR